MSLMTVDPQVKPVPQSNPVTADELRQLFLDQDICLADSELPADPETDLRLSKGGAVEDEHLLDFIEAIDRKYHVFIPLPGWTEAENARKPPPAKRKAFLSFATLADEVNRQKSGIMPKEYMPVTPTLKTPSKSKGRHRRH